MSTDDRHERFDQTTVDLVAKALPYALPPASRGVARHVLNALADAGLLLPPDGETTEQIEVQTAGLKYPCGDMAAAWRQLGELRGKDWVKDAWIVTRTVHYGPWRPVPPWTEVPQ